MKKIISFIRPAILLFAITALINSCKKSSSAPSGNYEMSFSNGGTAETYNNTSNTFAVLQSAGGETVCGLAGGSADGSYILGIDVTSPSALSTNITYTDTSLTNIATFELASSTGTVLSSTIFAATPNVRVNFSAITSTYIQGTFSGNMAPSIGSASTAVTNGTFYLPIK